MLKTATPSSSVHPPVEEHEQMLAHFLKFEQRFHRDYFSLWLGTLIGPGILTLMVLATVYVVSGSSYFWKLAGAAAFSFAIGGRFTIITPFPGLSPEELFWMVTYQDVMVALFFAFHVGFMYRLPKIGPKIAELSSDSQFILEHQPWMKRLTFLGLLTFIAFPLAATGSVGGAIFGRLLGLSRWAIFWGSTIGAVIGNVAMLFLAELVQEYLPADSALVQYGGIPIIVLIILVLERRYSSMKKAYVVRKLTTERIAEFD
ncbi:MAG: small multi-drug export protein [Planctomycetales bacterium]|nr:small multi-drug export protein [Planctomycetales bacterium]